MATDTGINDLLRNINNHKSIIQTAVAAAVATVTKEIAIQARQNHPFTNRTTNLENSIQALPVQIDGNMVNGAVNAGMEYAAYVEYGTSRSAPYPYLHPAVEANKENLINTIAAAIDRAEQVIRTR